MKTKTPFVLAVALSIFSLIIGIFHFRFFSVEQAAEAVSNLILDFSIVVSDLSKEITIGGGPWWNLQLQTEFPNCKFFHGGDR